MFSLVIPVYKNEGSIPDLIDAVKWIQSQLPHPMETVFVVDGSPDRSYQKLNEGLPSAGISYQLAHLTRNFGSFAAIRAGLDLATGEYFAVMAADLQEPKELIVTFFKELSLNENDILIGTRESRNDPLGSRLSSNLFWSLYRYWVQPDMPPGGVDIFACNKPFRDEILRLQESHSSLVGLIFWLGFRRKLINYSRLERQYGKSAWTLKKKFKYMMDSIFAFSDLPIKLLIGMGLVGLLASVIVTVLVLVSKLYGQVPVPGYAATVLVIVFFASLNSLGLGIIGNYIWRAFENTKRRPESIVLHVKKGR